MGGAERAARRRKQQAAATKGKPVAARRDDSRNTVLIGVGVVVVIAAIVIGGVLWQRSRSQPLDPPPVTRVAAEYPVAVDGAVIVAGETDADATIDVYEDMLCPACGAFERRDGERISEALAAGDLRVRYHVVNLLDEQSNPAGYSLDAAAATICAAEGGQFPSYHASLFGAQPEEGGRGYDEAQLTQLGRDLGLGDTFATCVAGGTHKEAVRQALATASADTALQRPGPGGGAYFGTPTVVADGEVVDLGNAAWLDEVLAG